MLTNDDLYSIKQVVSEELIKEFRPIKVDIRELKVDVGVLKTDVRGLKADVDDLRTDVNLIQKDQRKMRKDINMIVKLFDTDISETKHRVDRIETNLHLSTLV